MNIPAPNLLLRAAKPFWGFHGRCICNMTVKWFKSYAGSPSGWLLLLVLTFTIMGGEQSTFELLTDLSGRHAGQTVAGFLTLPLNARQIAVGRASGMPGTGAEGIPYSPAHTALLKKYTFSATHLEWLMGLRKEYAGACFPVLDIGTFSAYSQMFTVGTFSHARDINEAVSSPGALEWNVGGAFARSVLREHAALGVNAGFVHSSLAGDAAGALNLGIDAALFPVGPYAFRASVSNLGTALRYNETSEPQPLQIGVSNLFTGKIMNEKTGEHPLIVHGALGAMKTLDEPLRVGIAADLRLFRSVSVRAGYEYTMTEPITAEGIGVGAGLDILGYGADFGFRALSEELGNVWSVTLRYDTEELTPKTAMDYYNIALKHFNKGRYRLCILNARRALSRNPELWRAHALITRTISMMHRRKGTEIALVYTGNTDGQFLPVRTGTGGMGGLSRQITLVRRLRDEYPTTISIDGGNIINGATHPLKAGLASEYYSRADYDAVAAGTGEIDYGLERYEKSRIASHTSFVASNMLHSEAPNLVKSTILKAGRYRIAVMNLVNPQQLQNSLRTHLVAGLSTAVLSELSTSRVNESDLIVLVIHDTWHNVQRLARELPQVDIILCSSVPQRFEAPMKLGSTLFLSNGHSGRYVGRLVLRFDEEKRLLSHSNKLYPVTDDTPVDSSLDLMVRRIAAKLEEESGENPGLAPTRDMPHGVFPFLSDRHDVSTVYLRVPRELAGYRISAEEDTAFAPEVSFPQSRILYLSNSPDTPSTRLKIMDLSGQNRYTVPTSGAVRHATFTPDGRWVYFAVQSPADTTTDIYRVRSNGSDPVPVITWENASESNISFSPDGEMMLFTSTRTGTRMLYIADTLGTDPVLLTDEPANCSRPRYSPDGKYITFLSDRDSFGKYRDLWLHDVASGKRVKLTSHTDVHDYCWMPDGRRIVYETGVLHRRLYVRNIRENTNRPLRPREDKTFSETTPRVVGMGDEVKILYCRAYDDGDTRVFWINPEGTNEKCIVNSSGNDWLP